ncbi:MAG: hypothetical protein V7609_608 [Verrucomicrobiota bacterium]
MQSNTPEFTRLDKKIEKALRAFYDHARNKERHILQFVDDQGLTQSEAETAWIKELDALRSALDAAYSNLKHHIYPRSVCTMGLRTGRQSK